MCEASEDTTRKPNVEGCGMMLLGTEEHCPEGPLEAAVAGAGSAVSSIWMSTSVPGKPRQKHALSCFFRLFWGGVGLASAGAESLWHDSLVACSKAAHSGS